MKKVLLSWSSGKDSAWTLGRLLADPGLEVAGLLTTINESADRVAMHAVRRKLLEAQAEAVGLPLWAIPLPAPCSNSEYEKVMERACSRAVEEGIEAIAFGDLFLTDVRQYRERQLQGTGLEPLFPLWGRPTGLLAWEMIAAGLRAKITCVDPAQMDRRFAGREFDQSFLADLPTQADPCGENGEFHSFVYDAPEFRAPLAVRPGEILERDGFVFADLLFDGQLD